MALNPLQFSDNRMLCIELLVGAFDRVEVYRFANALYNRMDQSGSFEDIMEMTEHRLYHFAGGRHHHLAVALAVAIDEKKRNQEEENQENRTLLAYHEREYPERVRIIRARTKKLYKPFACAGIFLAFALGVATLLASFAADKKLSNIHVHWLHLFWLAPIACLLHFAQFRYERRFEIQELLSDDPLVVEFRARNSRV